MPHIISYEPHHDAMSSIAAASAGIDFAIEVKPPLQAIAADILVAALQSNDPYGRPPYVPAARVVRGSREEEAERTRIVIRPDSSSIHNTLGVASHVSKLLGSFGIESLVQVQP
jgi:hypothetical protein